MHPNPDQQLSAAIDEALAALREAQCKNVERSGDIGRRIERIEERQDAIEASLEEMRLVEATAMLFGWRPSELPLADWLAVELARGRGAISVWAAAFKGMAS